MQPKSSIRTKLVSLDFESIEKLTMMGAQVYWKNTGYKVKYDCDLDKPYIEHINGSIIGLTHQDGVTLNGQPEEFGIRGFLDGDEIPLHKLLGGLEYAMTYVMKKPNDEDTEIYNGICRGLERYANLTATGTFDYLKLKEQLFAFVEYHFILHCDTGMYMRYSYWWNFDKQGQIHRVEFLLKLINLVKEAEYEYHNELPEE